MTGAPVSATRPGPALSAQDHADVIATCIRFAWCLDDRRWEDLGAMFGPAVKVDYTELFGGSAATLAPGDLVLTGTPVGTALSAPPKPIQLIGNLLPPAVKWKAFFKRQAANPKYLQHGDVVEASVATDDGTIDLGTQRNTVQYA